MFEYTVEHFVVGKIISATFLHAVDFSSRLVSTDVIVVQRRMWHRGLKLHSVLNVSVNVCLSLCAL